MKQDNNNHLQAMLEDYYPYVKERLGFNVDPSISFAKDEENSKNPLGKTGYYNPNTYDVVVYTSGRHVKDVMRSLSHELVHHAQNCRGDFGGSSSVAGEQGYAQNDEHLRSMESEAYEQGSLIFRDREDGVKANQTTTYNQGEHDIMEHINKRHGKLNQRLMEAWGYKKKEEEDSLEEEVNEDEDSLEEKTVRMEREKEKEDQKAGAPDRVHEEEENTTQSNVEADDDQQNLNETGPGCGDGGKKITVRINPSVNTDSTANSKY